MQTRPHLRRSVRGFTLVEMIVVTLLLGIAMVALLSVFDASARINKNETDVADAQGAVRYGIYQMTRVIRMAGSGGLFVTQAVLNRPDPNIAGVNVGAGTGYDNVSAATVTDTGGTVFEVKNGTDIIELRGVILSPLVGFDQQTGCNGCTGSQPLAVLPITGDPAIGQHVNQDATNRPQFAAIDAYTGSASVADPMMVLVSSGNEDLHAGCSDANPGGATRYPQQLYNIGEITAGTQLVSSNNFGGNVNFGAARAEQINAEMPTDGARIAAPIVKVRRAGVLDDIIFYVECDTPQGAGGCLHPRLVQGIRRADGFQREILADDVEDMQVAYGVDTNGDNAVTRDLGCAGLTVNDPDPNFSNVLNCDEWVPNVDSETPLTDTDFQEQQPYVPGHPGLGLTRHCPRLHGVMISLLAKAADPDPTYRAPAATGVHIMNSTITPVTGPFRRRVQNLKVHLRNYAFQG